MNGILKIVFLVGLVSYAAAVCPCSRSPVGRECIALSPAGGTTCTSSVIPCSECFCDPAGTETCDSFTIDTLIFTDPDAGTCALSEVEVAICPSTSPTTAPTTVPTSGPATAEFSCAIDALIPWLPPLTCTIIGEEFPPGATILGGSALIVQQANGTAQLRNDQDGTAVGTFSAFINNTIAPSNIFADWPNIQTTLQTLTLDPFSNQIVTLALPQFPTTLAAGPGFIPQVQAAADSNSNLDVVFSTRATLDIGTGFTGGLLLSAFSAASVTLTVQYQV